MVKSSTAYPLANRAVSTVNVINWALSVSLNSLEYWGFILKVKVNGGMANIPWKSNSIKYLYWVVGKKLILKLGMTWAWIIETNKT